MLQNYEARLREVNKVPDDEKEVEDHRKMLKVFPLYWKNYSYYTLLTVCCFQD